MTTYTDELSRNAAVDMSTADPLIPTPVSAQIIQELPKQSAVMQLARKVPMSTKTQRTPVLSLLPTAYFVTGDTGLKQTSKVDWENVVLTAEELAVIVPIPEAYLDDAQVPIWDEVRPLIVQALAAKIDAATLFGTNKPATWGAAIVPAAISAGNTITPGTGEDLAVDIGNMALQLRREGFRLRAFASEPGFTWLLNNIRTTQGVPIYQPNLQGGPGNTLFGMPFAEVEDGGWDFSAASLIGGDWDKAIIGTRQDITFKMFTEGVISDDSGNIILNLMQQDSVALRCVVRLGWATANPVTTLESNADDRFPFSVLESLES